MKLSSVEKSMYEVMRALYESGIPITFKGAMVLKACLLEAGYSGDTRQTVDVDGNWNSQEAPSAEQMRDSLQKALLNNDVDLEVVLYRMYGKGRSAGFELKDSETGAILFTMDIDVNRPPAPTKVYEIEGFRFRGVAPSQMLADKISAISGNIVFRRIKDVIDLYYLSKVFAFDRADILRTLKNGGRGLGDFNGFLYRINDLEHAYEKFRLKGDIFKPTFKEVYLTVRSFIKPILPRVKDMGREI